MFFRFPEAKWHSLDTTADGLVLLRQIGGQKMKELVMRERRPHLMADNISFELNQQDVSRGNFKKY